MVFLRLNGQLSVRLCKPQLPHLQTKQTKTNREVCTVLCISRSVDKVLLTCRVVHKILHAHEFPITSAGSSTAEHQLCAAAQEPPGVAQGRVTWATWDKGEQSLFFGGMGIISLQPFFTLLSHLLAFFMVRSSESM